MNPFSQPSTLPYQLPPFDQIRNEHYLPGFEQGMSEQRAQVQAIVSDPAVPDFENTILALERAGQWKQSESDLLHALELKPDQPLVLNYLGYSWIDRGENLDRGLKMIDEEM